MASRSLTIDKSGIPYTLKRSHKRKRTVALSIAPDLSVRVVAPLDTPLKVIEEIIKKRSSWLFQKIADMHEFRFSRRPREFISGETVSFLGKQYLLRVTKDDSAGNGCLIRDNLLLVNIENIQLTDEDLRQEVRFEIVLWYKKQAKKKLADRIIYWSKKLEMKPRSLILSNQKRRWGSCDSKNNIRLNWRIVMAPLTIIDYVVVHELCHIKYKDHSHKFWQLVASAMPDYEARTVLLHKNGSDYELF